MSFSVNTIIKNKPLADGTYPVYIRLIIAGTAAYQTTGISTSKKNFDKRSGLLKNSAPAAQEINAYLKKRVEVVLLKVIEKDNITKTPKIVLALSEPTASNFLQYCQKYISIREQKGQFETVEIYKDYINQLKQYKSKINLSDITEDWINGYVRFLTKTNGRYTIKRKLKFFSGVMKLALKTNSGINHFEDYEYSGGKAKIKEIPTFAEIQTLIDVRHKISERQRVGLDIYLTQYFLRGIRVSDIILLTHDKVHENHVLVREAKNDEWKRMGLHPVLKEILSQYNEPHYVFPMCRWYENQSLSQKENRLARQKEISTATTKINKAIKLACKAAGITKHLTNHTARHGFATQAIQVLNGDLRRVQGLLNHAQFQTTEAYVHDLQRSDYSEDENQVYKGLTINKTA